MIHTIVNSKLGRTEICIKPLNYFTFCTEYSLEILLRVHVGLSYLLVETINDISKVHKGRHLTNILPTVSVFFVQHNSLINRKTLLINVSHYVIYYANYSPCMFVSSQNLWWDKVTVSLRNTMAPLRSGCRSSTSNWGLGVEFSTLGGVCGEEVV